MQCGGPGSDPRLPAVHACTVAPGGSSGVCGASPPTLAHAPFPTSLPAATHCRYHGNERSMLIPNTIFRMGSGVLRRPLAAAAAAAAAAAPRCSARACVFMHTPACPSLHLISSHTSPLVPPSTAATCSVAAAAAILLTNKRSERRRAKYSLEHVVRVHLGADDAAYK